MQKWSQISHDSFFNIHRVELEKNKLTYMWVIGSFVPVKLSLHCRNIDYVAIFLVISFSALKERAKSAIDDKRRHCLTEKLQAILAFRRPPASVSNCLSSEGQFAAHSHRALQMGKGLNLMRVICTYWDLGHFRSRKLREGVHRA